MDAMVSREDFTVAILINQFNLHVYCKSLTLYPKISMPFSITKTLADVDRPDHRYSQLVKMETILTTEFPFPMILMQYNFYT